MDKFSKQFTTNRTLLMECHSCGNQRMKIYRKSCVPMDQDGIEYKSCMIWVECTQCSAADDFFINKDHYGYIDAKAKPLKGEWKL